LIGDTKTLLSHWDVRATVDENIKRIHRENVFGKDSRSRVEDILAIFRSRYLREGSVTKALATFVRKKFPPAALDRLLYFHSARADRLLHDVVTEVLFPMRQKGLMHVGVQDFQKPLGCWVLEGKTIGKWSEATITRIAQGLLSTLRDFGVLEGAVNKKIITAFFPIEAFAYIAFYLKQHQPSGAKLIELADWKLGKQKFSFTRLDDARLLWVEFSDVCHNFINLFQSES
jgi:bacteriophage exclusion system BrxA-like protein